MEHIKESIQKLFSSTGIDKQVKNYQSVADWPSIAGKRIAAVTEVKYFSKGVLFVKVKNDAWRNEIIFHKNELIEKINKESGVQAVKDIVLI